MSDTFPSDLASGVTLDHIAVAVPDIECAISRVRALLGATIISGDSVPGYRYLTLRVGDADVGMNLELLEPWQSEADDFLARFVAQHGASPHHMTFLQPDVRSTVDQLQRRGFPLVRTKLDFGPWQESFVHPSSGCGTVVQLASSTVSSPPMASLLAASDAGEAPPPVPYDERSQNPFWWGERYPPIARSHYSVLHRIVVGIADLALVEELFGGVLGGHISRIERGVIDVNWGASGQIRFISSDAPGVMSLECTGLEEDFSIGAAHFRAHVKD